MWKAALACLYIGALLIAVGLTVIGGILLGLGFLYVLARAN
jgi:hypothetical protein